MSEITKEVEQLFPQGKSVMLKGKQFTIKPFGFGKFPKILKILKTITDTPSVVAGETRPTDILVFVANNSEIVVDLCVIATGEQESFFDDVELDEAVDLVKAIIVVNADFFIKRLQPKLMEAFTELTASLGGVSSQLLSRTATA